MLFVVDARVDDLLTSVLTEPLARRRSAGRTIDQSFKRGLSHVLEADRVAGWEWAIAIVAIFLFGRSNILFFRQRLSGLFGGRADLFWQDDLVLQIVFGVVQLTVLIVALRRARASALLRQPALLAFATMAWLSIMWSVEPTTSVRRALFFVGTVVVGWYIGDRFSPRAQIGLVAAVGCFAAVSTVVGLVFWNELARSTGRNFGWWSGIYVNRNLLGAVMAYGVMAVLFLLRMSKRKWPLRILLFVLVVILFFTRSRTGPVALVCALAVVVAVWLFRWRGHDRLSSAAGAYVTFASLGTIGLVVHWYWMEILTLLKRDPSLTNRRWIWQVDRWFADQRPWTGWGFESIWTNPRAVEQSYHATGVYPFQAHNGYYELQLSLGRVGLLLFVLFLGTALWRAFRYAWTRGDAASLWPLAFIVFAVITNFSESMFISSEAMMALTVAAAVGVTEWSRREAG